MTEDFDIREEHVSPSEREFENALRPPKFEDFSGQNKVVENLEVFVEAAKYRGEPLDHTLLHGPPGLDHVEQHYCQRIGCRLQDNKRSCAR